MTEDPVPVQAKRDHYARESIDEADFEQSTTRDLDSHAVWNQGGWWRYSSRDEAYYAQDEGRAEGSEEKSCVSVGHVADALEIKGIGDNQKGNGHDNGQKGCDEAEFLPGHPVRVEQLISDLISDIWRVVGVGVLLDLDVASCAPQLFLFFVVDHRRNATRQARQFCSLFCSPLFET